MADRRSIMMEGLVNPAVLPGLYIIAGEVTADDTKTITITFPAKTIIAVLAQTTGTSVAKTESVTNNIGTVVFTLTGDGTVTYLIFASATETIAALDAGTSNISITPTR